MQLKNVARVQKKSFINVESLLKLYLLPLYRLVILYNVSAGYILYCTAITGTVRTERIERVRKLTYCTVVTLGTETSIHFIHVKNHYHHFTLRTSLLRL